MQAKRGEPDFLIIGAAKCGTTSLVENLNLHPEVYIPNKEVHYFTKHLYKNKDWYLSKFNHYGKIQGEKSPSYLYYTQCHNEIYEMLPQIKLIVMLRDPIQRAFSNWNMRYNDKRLIRQGLLFIRKNKRQYRLNSLNFESLVDFYLSHRGNYSLINEKPLDIIHRSLYALQLKNLLRFFNHENILVIISELYFQNEQKIHDKICKFLNISDYKPKSFKKCMVGQYRQSIPTKAAEKLRQFFSPLNEELFQLIGYKVPQWEK